MSKSRKRTTKHNIQDNDQPAPKPLNQWEAFAEIPKIPSAWKIGKSDVSDQIELATPLREYQTEKEKGIAKVQAQSRPPPVADVQQYGLAPNLRYNEEENKYETVGRRSNLLQTDEVKNFPSARSTAHNLAGLSDLFAASNDVMKISNADRYLKWGRYDMAELILGRKLTCEELQRRWLVPPERNCMSKLNTTDIPKPSTDEKAVQKAVEEAQQAAAAKMSLDQQRMDERTKATRAEEVIQEEAANKRMLEADKVKDEQLKLQERNLESLIEHLDNHKDLQDDDIIDQIKGSVDSARASNLQDLQRAYDRIKDVYPSSSVTYLQLASANDLRNEEDYQGSSGIEKRRSDIVRVLYDLTSETNEIRNRDDLSVDEKNELISKLTDAYADYGRALEVDARMAQKDYRLDNKIFSRTFRGRLLNNALRPIAGIAWSGIKAGARTAAAIASAASGAAVNTALNLALDNANLLAPAALGYVQQNYGDVVNPLLDSLRTSIINTGANSYGYYHSGRRLMNTFNPRQLGDAIAVKNAANTVSGAAGSFSNLIGNVNDRIQNVADYTAPSIGDLYRFTRGKVSDVTGGIQSLLPSVDSVITNTIKTNAVIEDSKEMYDELVNGLQNMTSPVRTIAKSAIDLSRAAAGDVVGLGNVIASTLSSAPSTIQRSQAAKRLSSAFSTLSSNISSSISNLRTLRTTRNAAQVVEKSQKINTQIQNSLVEYEKKVDQDVSELKSLGVDTKSIETAVDDLKARVHRETSAKVKIKRKSRTSSIRLKMKPPLTKAPPREPTIFERYFPEKPIKSSLAAVRSRSTKLRSNREKPVFRDFSKLSRKRNIRPIMSNEQQADTRRSVWFGGSASTDTRSESDDASASDVESSFGRSCSQSDGDRLLLMIGQMDAGNDSYILYREVKKLLTKMEKTQQLPIALIRQIRRQYLRPSQSSSS